MPRNPDWAACRPQTGPPWQVAPVRIIGGEQLRLLVVLFRVHRFGNDGLTSVRADDNVRVLFGRRAILGVTANADDLALLLNDFSYREPFADFRSRFGGGIDEDFVENCPARAVGDRACWSARCSRYGELAEVERISVDRRASGCDDAVEKAPSAERVHSGRVNQVRGNRVARESCAVYYQDLVAFTREQHRRGRSGAACAHYDDVVFICRHDCLRLWSVYREAEASPTAVFAYSSVL